MKNLILLILFCSNGILFSQPYLAYKDTKEGVKYGYLSNDFKELIAFQFDYATDFSENRAFAKLNEKWFCINIKGERLFEINGSPMGDFTKGLAVIFSMKGYYYIDTAGNKMFNKFYEFATELTNGLARVKFNSNGNTGYINHKGDLVIDTIYRFCRYFNNGYAGFYKLRSGWGLIDTLGKIVLEPIYQNLGDFSEGLIAFTNDTIQVDTSKEYKIFLQNQRWGYMDISGNIIIQPKFSNTGEFKDSLAVVSYNRKYGFINHSGEFVIQPMFSEADNFSEGYAPVNFGTDIVRGLYNNFINKKGEIVLKGDFWFPQDFKNGICRYSDGRGRHGSDGIKYMDKTGKVLW